MPAKRVELHLGDIDAVDKHAPGFRGIETGHQFCECAFTGTTRSHKGNKTTYWNVKIDASQLQRRGRFITEFNVLEINLSLNGWHHHALVVIFVGFLRGINHIAEALKRKGDFLNTLPD